MAADTGRVHAATAAAAGTIEAMLSSDTVERVIRTSSLVAIDEGTEESEASKSSSAHNNVKMQVETENFKAEAVLRLSNNNNNNDNLLETTQSNRQEGDDGDGDSCCCSCSCSSSSSSHTPTDKTFHTTTTTTAAAATTTTATTTTVATTVATASPLVFVREKKKEPLSSSPSSSSLPRQHHTCNKCKVCARLAYRSPRCCRCAMQQQSFVFHSMEVFDIDFGLFELVRRIDDDNDHLYRVDHDTAMQTADATCKHVQQFRKKLTHAGLLQQQPQQPQQQQPQQQGQNFYFVGSRRILRESWR